MRKAPLFLLVMVLLLAMATAQILLPPRSMSEPENRKLSQFPAFSLSTLCNGSFADALEVYLADQLPFRDQFVSIYAGMQGIMGRRLINDAILGKNHCLYDASADWSVRNVRLNTSALAELLSRTGREVFLMVVPSSAAVYPENLPAYAPVADETVLLSAVADSLHVLPLMAALKERREEAHLYYATDHHWTAAGARVGYLTVCDAFSLPPQEEKPLLTYPGFFGSFYARCPLPWQKGDVFSYAPEEGICLSVDGEAKPALVDETALTGRDKYAALLYGNHGLIELTNDHASEGTLIVIKDSYANMLLPMLAVHYRHIVAIDPRYFAGNIVETINLRRGWFYVSMS